MSKKNGVNKNSQPKLNLNLTKSSTLRRNKSSFTRNDLVLSEPKLIANLQATQRANLDNFNMAVNRLNRLTPNKEGMIPTIRRVDSTPNSQGFKIKASLNPLSPTLNTERQKRLEIDDNSFINSKNSKDSASSRHKTEIANKYESSSEEYDTLKSEINRHNTKSLPISMKDMPKLHFEPTSRDSFRGEPIVSKNNVDRYFSDMNGNSIFSTNMASDSLFGSISSNNLSNRNSLLSGSKSNRGVNAANQILFGHKAAVMPAYQSAYHDNSDKYSHDGFSQSKSCNMYKSVVGNKPRGTVVKWFTIQLKL